MRSLIQSFCFLLFLISDLFAVTNSTGLAERLADIKARSSDHENRIANLLSKPAFKSNEYNLPLAPVEKTESLQQRQGSSTEIPYVSLPDYEDSSSVESDAEVGDFSSSTSRYESSSDTNEMDSSGKEDLDEAYAKLYESDIPSRREDYYFGPIIGIAIPDDGAIRVAGSIDPYEAENGYILGFQLGKDFGTIRTEAEYAYINFDGSAGLAVSSHSFLARVILEKEFGDLVDLRAGMGMGIGFIGMEGAGAVDTSDLGFAYDFLLGMGYNLGENWSLCLDYRYYLTAANERYDRVKSHGLILSANFDL